MLPAGLTGSPDPDWLERVLGQLGRHLPGSDYHSVRVAGLSLKLAEAIGLTASDLTQIYLGALLHDIGKLTIAADVLNRPGPLSDAEWEIIRCHPEFGRDILAQAGLGMALDGPYAHHERWDGNGYPRGLRGQAIPLIARIVTVVDVWDALLDQRPYKQAWSQERALQYMSYQAGKQFDPLVGMIFSDLARAQQI